ncbi:type II secretion system F family protein [Alteromonas lipolytica]|uniref:MSHA biogenesis protein MshG n=1 Tax=Alteromonas lipolytica TaxID=1856405 RepID=A0A1E8F8I8_9ALTE|nr:type II secretion system F family protein [Alteromonas lipolytica]OFI32225.1 MSHA biogenesis protein MshG [Alteromonas lipolytica]GGF82880.1 MSHA biogenesis protein MshG [Alteromonas lipolytica]
MPKFSYKGREPGGEMRSGMLDALDANAAAKMLLARSITPISISEVAGSGEKSEVKVNFLTPQVSLDELVIFSRQMYSLTHAGIPILRAVSSLAESSSSIRLKIALSDIISLLERGRTLSSAMHQHSKIFDRLYVSVVHVGENTGRLDEAFLQLAGYLEREQETRRQIKAATRYPIFVVIALIGALITMNVFVIPKFADMFNKFGAELPVMTRFLLGMSDFFINQWYVLIGGTLALVLGIRSYLNTPDGRLAWSRKKLRLPVIGKVLERSLLARFCRSFSMMLQAGLPLTTALNLVAEAVGNRFMELRILDMRQSIEKGENLSRVTQASGLFTPMVLQMVNVGEETGRVDELLAEVADFYEREVDYDLNSLTAKIEPILIGIVAGMVLVLALGIFTPMWDMMSAIKGQ